MKIAKMNSTTLYIATNQILLKADPNNFATWIDLYRLIPYLRNSLCCVVCGNLLIHPYTPASGRCQHHVCKKCKDGRKKIKPTCSWCKDCKRYTENITLRMLLQCYKRMCKLIMTSRIFTKLYISAKKGITAVGVERGAPNLMSLIREGAALRDHFRLSQHISKSLCAMLPCLYTNTSSHSLLMASAEINRLLNNNAISTGTLYPTHSAINSNMLKRKTRDFYDDAESRLHMQQRLKLDKDVVVKNAKSSKMVVNHNGEIYGSDQNQPQSRVNKEKVFKRPSVVRMEMKLRRGCRCGNATPTPGKLTCCGQRCPCYVESKSCINCRCKGCRNPHHLDGSKGICFKNSSANRMNSNHIRSEKQYNKDATLHNSISTNINTNQQNGSQTLLRIIKEPGSTKDIYFQDLTPINANIANGQNLNNHIKQKLATGNDTYSRNIINNKVVKNFKRAQASNQFNEKKIEAERSRYDMRNGLGINKPTIFTNYTNDMLPSNIESNVYAFVSQNSSHSITSQNNSYVSISLNNSYGSTSLNNSNPFTSQSNSYTSIPIKHHLGSSKSNLQQTSVSNLKKTSSESGCNCGHGGAIPDKLCCNDQSCPCYAENKSCHKCQCVQCFNLSLEDLVAIAAYNENDGYNESPEYNDYDIGNIPDTDVIQDRATVEMDSVSSAESFDNIDSGESNFFEDVSVESNPDVILDRLLNIKQEPEFKLEHVDTLESKPYTSTGMKQLESINVPSLDSFNYLTNLKLDVDKIFDEEPLQKNAMESSNKSQKSTTAFRELGTSMESVSDNSPATKVTFRSRAPVKRSREMGHEEYELNKLPTSKFIVQSTNATQKNLDKFKEPFFFPLATSAKNGSDKKVSVKSGTASLVSILSENKASMRVQQRLEISDETYSNVAIPNRLVSNTVDRNQSSIKQELGCRKDTISKNFSTYKSAVFSNANFQINNEVKQKPGTNKTVPSQTSTSNVGVNSIPRTERRIQIKQKITIGRGNGIKRVVPTKVEIKLKRGCRCGTATRNPGKLTCCGQRCPCYVENRACLECHCKGCRNPHRADGSKVPTQASQMEYLSAISRQTPQKQNLQTPTQSIPPGFKFETLTLEQFRESLKNANLAFVNPTITPQTIVIDDRSTDDGGDLSEDDNDDIEIEVDY